MSPVEGNKGRTPPKQTWRRLQQKPGKAYQNKISLSHTFLIDFSLKQPSKNSQLLSVIHLTLKVMCAKNYCLIIMLTYFTSPIFGSFDAAIFFSWCNQEVKSLVHEWFILNVWYCMYFFETLYCFNICWKCSDILWRIFNIIQHF